MRYQDKQLVISGLSSLVIILGLGVIIIGLSRLRPSSSHVLGTQTQTAPAVVASPASTPTSTPTAK